MKDKIKKKLILKNDPKQKIGIKRMRTKFEKKKGEDNLKFSFEGKN
jgi:hypothetical protein